MILNRDIWSWFKPGCVYGRKGDEVSLVADHGNVWIVQGVTGTRFTIPLDAIEGVEIKDPERIVEKPPVQGRPIKKTKSVPYSPQTALF